jgi:hypothetical protein
LTLYRADGKKVQLLPAGAVRATNADPLLPMLLEGAGAAELPDCIVAN